MWNFYVLDPKTFVAEQVLSMPAGFPDLHDMTYDYTTSTAFAVGGPTGGEAVYIVDLKTGLLTKIMETEQTFMSVTAGPDGKLYAAELGTSSIYVIDPGAETCELLTESGYFSFGVGSMSYDYENDIIYWTNYGTLGLLDPKTGESTSLGTIGPGGEMLEVMGLFTMSEHVPQEPLTYALKNLFLSAEKVILTGRRHPGPDYCGSAHAPDRSGHLVFLQRKRLPRWTRTASSPLFLWALPTSQLLSPTVPAP